MSDRLFVATRKGVFGIIRRPNGRWEIETASFLGVSSPIVMHDPRDGSLLAALEHGHFGAKVHRSADLGHTWEELSGPAYPEKPEGDDDRDPMRGTPLEWKLKKIWALVPGGADEPGRVWCGTIPGALFTSLDGGRSWEIIRSLWDEPRRRQWFGGGADQPGIHSICVDPRDSRRVLVGVSCGGAWLTTDSGATWTIASQGMRADFMPPDQQMDPNIQDPHSIVQCQAQPHVYWAQHHNGIFRSMDGAKSWYAIENAKPSDFGFAVAVHPMDGELAWFVPSIKDELRYPVDAAVVVSRTRDGGKTFDVLRNGLPQVHAYDLTYRHAFDLDSSGYRLAFGSTTGSLWISEDQGDAWQTISKHLPPIHCVRFA